MASYSYDFVVYGGDPWAVAAAVAAQKVRTSLTVAIVVDYPPLTAEDQAAGGFGGPNRLGGISTVGGQCTWDDNTLGRVPRGTYKYGMLDYTTRYYAPEYLADRLRVLCEQHNVTVFYGYHVASASTGTNANGRRFIQSVTFHPIRFGTNHYYEWDPTREDLIITARFFADCSVDGRLTRAALQGVYPWTYGRYDWPTSVLPDDEEPYSYARAQAMTLCVRLGNFPVTGGGTDITRDIHNGHYGGLFATNAFRNTGSALAALNRTLYAEGGRMLMGPSNWAQEYPSTSVVWATGPHIFNVVAGAFEKDRGTPLFPPNMDPNALTMDQAYQMLKQELLSGRYIEALRRDLGVPNLTLLAVAPILYVRESFHVVNWASSIAHGTEASNYIITPAHAIKAGSGSSDGSDAWAYSERVGVAFYGIDQHGYRFTDHYDPATGTFYWRPDVERRLRPDLTSQYGSGWMSPPYGFYLPYRMLVSRYCANLLLAGYATQCCAIAWGELRVAPNLCTLGDAAGATVGVVLNQGFSTDLFTLVGNTTFYSALQSALRSPIAANLDTKN